MVTGWARFALLCFAGLSHGISRKTSPERPIHDDVNFLSLFLKFLQQKDKMIDPSNLTCCRHNPIHRHSDPAGQVMGT